MVVRGKAIQLNIVRGVTYKTVARYLQSAVLHFDNKLENYIIERIIIVQTRVQLQ